MNAFKAFVLAALSFSLAPPAARADIHFLGEVSIPGDSSDLSGLRNTLEDQTPHNRLGGLGSGIAYTGSGNRYVLVADRGPKDGAVSFKCRIHWMDILVGNGVVQAKLVRTALLTDRTGEPFVGSIANLGKSMAGTPLRLDPEGICVSKHGHYLIADEYGPAIHEFNQEGKRVGSVKVPGHFLPEVVHANPKDELKTNTKGRVPNRGFEGLTITPDGSRLYAALQGPLIQDGGRDGTNVRLLEIHLSDGLTREYAYPLAARKLGISEILAIRAHTLLVLERDGASGKEQFKKIYRVELANADDVSSLQSLPAEGLPRSLKPVSKKLLIDLLDPRFGLAGKDFPAKIEGMTFGPDLPDGRRLLIVTSDNDFVAEQPTRLFAFAIDAQDLE